MQNILYLCQTFTLYSQITRAIFGLTWQTNRPFTRPLSTWQAGLHKVITHSRLIILVTHVVDFCANSKVVAITGLAHEKPIPWRNWLITELLCQIINQFFLPHSVDKLLQFSNQINVTYENQQTDLRKQEYSGKNSGSKPLQFSNLINITYRWQTKTNFSIQFSVGLKYLACMSHTSG